MRKMLSEKAHRKLLKHHKVLGEELRRRRGLRFVRTVDAIEKMLDLITKNDSWERR